MEERTLGRRGLAVSRLGLGLAAIGRPGYITLGRADDLGADRSPEALYARCAAMLDAARAAGVRYVDAARSYGRAEEFLARWLAERGLAADAVTVGSKWGYRYTAGWSVDAPVHEQKELTAERQHEQLAETRALLGRHLALWQIHSATVESGVLDDSELLAALVEGRRAGTYRAVGLTLSGPRSADALERALDARAGGEPVFDVVQATINVLEPSLAPLLEQAHTAGLGVIAKEIHANGRLTGANARPDDAAMLAKARALAGRAGMAVDQLAVAFVAGLPFVDVVLSGAATAGQLASHADAVGRALPSEVHAAVAELRETPATYWTTRATLPWS